MRSLIFLVNSDKDLSVILSDCELIVVLRDHSLPGAVELILDPQKFASKSSFLPVSDATHVNRREVLDEIIEGDPEAAISDVEDRLDRSNHFRGPKRRVVTPVALPLEAAPRVPNVEEPMPEHILDLDNTVGVSWDESTRWLCLATLCQVIFARCVSRYNVALLIKGKHLLE